MTTSEFVQATILKATGKASSLVSTDTKWIKIVAIANRQIRKWERIADWNSLYVPEYTAGTVTATNVIELDDEVRKISDAPGDSIRIVYNEDENLYTEWAVVNAESLKLYPNGNYCAQIGRTIRFNRTFAETDVEFGGTIKVPVYLYAELLTTSGSEVSVDDPEWLIVMSAAEYIRNDITKKSDYPNLVSEANDILETMLDDNDGQVYQVPRFGVGV